MDRALLEYYEESFNTFATKGWQYLMEDFQKLRDQYNDLSSCPDAHTLDKRLGQLDILDLFLTRKAVTERAWQDLQADEEADSA